jgi:hypothetical protein
MVKGIDKFKEFFADYADNYIIIGGTACDIYEEKYAQVPRATKDIDIILVIEALSSEFVTKFWEFIRVANYDERNKGVSDGNIYKHEYYRFKKPEDNQFPYQIELFSRSIELIPLPEDAHITPIPIDDDLSSLSAILMNDDYYNFTIEHSLVEDSMHLAKIESLICLKAKAVLDLNERKTTGERIDSRHIDKHRKDVFRLSAMLAEDNNFQIPASLKSDLTEFSLIIKDDLPNSDFFKNAGLGELTGAQLLLLIKKVFNID